MESSVHKSDINASDTQINEIRSELSGMSFEDLRALKQKLGLKIYKEAMFGKKSVTKTEFKRMNKNRPREMSSKIKPNIRCKVKHKLVSDPRFNRLCGTFNKRHFNNAYNFLTTIRRNEKEELKKILKTETDPKELEKIKYLIERMENQEREENRLNRKNDREMVEMKEHIKALESGKKIHFKTKYEKKIVDLLDTYSTLKKEGKIEKYIEKKVKKEAEKDRKKRKYFECNNHEEI